MGYTQYLDKKKDIPDTQWYTLCEKVAEAFKLLPTHYPRNSYNFPCVICDASGKKPITHVNNLFIYDEGVFFISFNGNELIGLSCETFELRQTGRQDGCEKFCKTRQRPYDWFVVTVLILVHNLCPDCYEISSDGKKEDWQPILDWLCQSLNASYVLPPNI